MEEYLKTIKDADATSEKEYRTREAARAVVFDKDGKVLLLYVSNYGFHKLPGGGLETGEGIEEALRREVREETGCGIQILQKIGSILEYRSAFTLKQTSSCFIAEVTDEGETEYTKKEKSEGFRLERLSLDEAIATLIADQPENYEGLFIQKRDLEFLKKAKDILTRSTDVSEMKDRTTKGSWVRGSSHGQKRMDIRPGMKVAIVLKNDQPTGRLTEGIVKDILTGSANHPRGIKVRLTDGQVGRVQFLK